MKNEYDFSKAVRSKFYRAGEPSQIVIHLPETPSHPRFEVFQSGEGAFHFRLKDDLHIVFASEPFPTKAACLKALSELKQTSILAPTVFA